MWSVENEECRKCGEWKISCGLDIDNRPEKMLAMPIGETPEATK